MYDRAVNYQNFRVRNYTKRRFIPKWKENVLEWNYSISVAPRRLIIASGKHKYFPIRTPCIQMKQNANHLTKLLK